MAWHRFQPNDRTFLNKQKNTKQNCKPSTPHTTLSLGLDWWYILLWWIFLLEWFMSITAWPLNNVWRLWRLRQLNRPQFFTSPKRQARPQNAKSQCRMIQSRSPRRCRWFLLSIRLERIISSSFRQQHIFFHTPFIIKFIALVREKEFSDVRRRRRSSHPKRFSFY